MSYYTPNPHECETVRTEFYCSGCDAIKDQDGHMDSNIATCNYCGNENEYIGDEHKYAVCNECDWDEVHIDNKCVKCGSVNSGQA